MAERIRELLEKLKAWWDKFTPRQKTLIVCAVAGVIVGLTILITACNPVIILTISKSN